MSDTYIIGIDPGVKTGYAVWDGQALIQVGSMMIHQAMFLTKSWTVDKKIFVRMEDARKRKWFGEAGREQLQGAGSIKRDCQIWEDFLLTNQIPYELVPPRNNKTKTSAKYFRQVTGWNEQTNEHARDAGFLVFGYKVKHFSKCS